ncbi:restriction endonuclease subunit M [Vagococcus lutrae]|uniref:BREX-1 system adenine-specific DNA-methyltransferase PglX n=1 Tax=Vagococcus lutrae TaxID=81947 RepID=UPI001927BABB|nr:BREX-1 system adenine-specific DNA-methyltransferase PglX [Vagococcus lutrae]GEQ61301.1 restriction endonuclease subunit M [Vagococcus lutrae]GEQ63254.1 restriction endonuclease subunit M [Vagococcus lutrae]GEQ65145.1 restriction endonuclease subunit M [Vagococcus lutrae]
MNQGKLKTFAVEARRELLEKVALQARKIGVTKDSIKDASVESSDALIINGQHLSKEERVQRNKLIRRIDETSFEQVMEEAAYTWFNRFVALRFMEVNDYLPTRVRVLSSLDGGIEPDMMKEALSLGLDIDNEKVYEMKLNNHDDELFKYLIIAHCNDLNDYLPFMFGTIEDYTEILFPEGLLNTDSFVRKMTNTEVFPEEDWYEVEIIGWLYQFYISEEKDRVSSKKSKYDVADIPAVTQLFTPDWIVKYLVQNSVGRKWLEAHPEHSDLAENWDYYIIHEADNYEESIAPYVDSSLKVEDIKVLDPAMGSGHILVYTFDLLYEIYIKTGYTKNEIPRLILKNNLYGLEIDDRAYQLASFSLVMKALQYDNRFLTKIQRQRLNMNIAAIQETNNIPKNTIQVLTGEDSGVFYDSAEQFINQYKNAKTYGSLIKTDISDTSIIEERVNEIKIQPLDDILITEEVNYIINEVPKLIKQNEILSSKYDVLVMNPPYMTSSSMNDVLKKFVNKEYPRSKSDMFATFMELDHLLDKNSLYAAINMHSWMFLSSFENLRKHIISSKQIDSMLHLGARAFEEIRGEVVQTTAFILRNYQIDNFSGTYMRLVDFNKSVLKSEKAKEALANPGVTYRYTFNQKAFKEIPGSAIAYWISDNLIKVFTKSDPLMNYANCATGMQTGNNNKYMRLWFEINYNQFNSKPEKTTHKWQKYNAGGNSRKWYGNHTYVIYWENDGHDVKADKKSVIRNEKFYFKEGISWKRIGSSDFFLRYLPSGFIIDQSGDTMYMKDDKWLNYILGYVNTKVALESFNFIAPTLNLTAGNMNKLPIILNRNYKDTIEDLIEENIDISKKDWDSFETSWDFVELPLIRYRENSPLIEESYNKWVQVIDERFNQLKINEEELNRIFIDIYGLQNELTPEVSDRDITLTKIYDNAKDIPEEIKGNQYVLTKKDVIQQFISYAVGCMFGRYSLDEEGLVYAGGEFDTSRYETYSVVEDNIIPITSDVYLEDDLVNRFIEFVETVYGKERLEENLNFIAEALGQKKNETARDTIHSYFLKDFFKDHAKMYSVTGSGRRPIYWKFTSGRENAFNCFIYMHRYDKTTISRIRTEYLHDVQQRLEIRKVDLDQILNSDASTTELNKARKEMKTVEKQLAELIAYDEKLRHMADQQIEIDLDDGFKVNYPKFKGLVEKV